MNQVPTRTKAYDTLLPWNGRVSRPAGYTGGRKQILTTRSIYIYIYTKPVEIEFTELVCLDGG